jgi:hypothetical protein
MRKWVDEEMGRRGVRIVPTIPAFGVFLPFLLACEKILFSINTNIFNRKD